MTIGKTAGSLSIFSPSRVLWLGALLRVGFLLLSGKLHETEYWEYGQIVQQLLAGHGYSFPFTDEGLKFLPAQFYPSALMPPGYVFFLLPFMLVPDLMIRNILLFGTQIILSVLAMQLVYRWSEKQLGKTAALLILFLQCLYPELIYACTTVGPTIWFHLLFAGILFSLSEKKHPALIGILAGMLVLMRSEAILPLGILLMAEFWKGRKKTTLISAMALLFCLLPWLIRNQLVLGKPMLSASVGVNFFRGNNAGEIGDWPVFSKTEIERMKSDPARFEQESDAAALQMAKTWVLENPDNFLFRLSEKISRFWILDWPDKRTHSLFYWLPWLICFPLGMAGLWKMNFQKAESLAILFLTYTAIIMVFFPQARYLSLIKFFWMIPAGLGLTLLKRNFWPEKDFQETP